MSRTTKTLRRLGVPGLAAAMVVTGFPFALGGTAQAVTGDVVTLTPTTASASIGTCRTFTVNVTNAGAAVNRNVTVIATEVTPGGTAATETLDVDFCAVSGGATGTARTDVDVDDSDIAAENEISTFATGTDGTFTFGLRGGAGSSTGAIDIDAFVDDDNDGRRDAGEDEVDSSQLTLTAGGSNAVAAVVVTPENATNFLSETHNVTASLRNAAGDTVAGVDPDVDVTGANDAAAVNCDASDNDGVSRCTYTGTRAGNDTIVVWVDQTTATRQANNALDSGEPSDTATKTYLARPTGNTIVLSAGTATSAREDADDTVQLPGNNRTEVFSARVTRRDANNAVVPAAGLIVRFAVIGSGAGTETLNPVEATTDANGVATTTLTDTVGQQNEEVEVRATIRGQETNATSDARVTYVVPASTSAATATVTTAAGTSAPGTFRLFTVTVVDQRGLPVSNATGTVTVSGVGRLPTGLRTAQIVTGANGQAQFETTTGATETGEQTVTVTVSGSGGTTTSRTATATVTFAPGGTTTTPATGTVTIAVNTPTITAGGRGSITLTGPANADVVLEAYTRPNTTFRVVRTGTLSANGTLTFDNLVPSGNTRLRARVLGGQFAQSAVLLVRSRLSVTAQRVGVRTYRFSGRVLPAREGQLVFIYRGNVLATTARVQANGTYAVNRRFLGTGTFNFTARTTTDITNVGGISNMLRVTIR